MPVFDTLVSDVQDCDLSSEPQIMFIYLILLVSHLRWDSIK